MLAVGGRMVLHLNKTQNRVQQSLFDDYGFSQEEKFYWLEKVRLLSDEKQVQKMLYKHNFKCIDIKNNKSLGCILIFEKRPMNN